MSEIHQISVHKVVLNTDISCMLGDWKAYKIDFMHIFSWLDPKLLTIVLVCVLKLNFKLHFLCLNEHLWDTKQTTFKSSHYSNNNSYILFLFLYLLRKYSNIKLARIPAMTQQCSSTHIVLVNLTLSSAEPNLNT